MTIDTRLQMPHPAAASLAESEDGYRAFALPSTFGEFVPMVELRLANGDRVGLPYPWLVEVRFDPSAGVTLAFTTGATVVIRGRHLGGLFTALLRHQAVYVREADPPTAELLADGVPVVESIRVAFGGR